MKVHHSYRSRARALLTSAHRERSSRERLVVAYRRVFDAYDKVRALGQRVAARYSPGHPECVICLLLEDDLSSLLDECEQLFIAEDTVSEADLQCFVGRTETVIEEVALLVERGERPTAGAVPAPL